MALERELAYDNHPQFKELLRKGCTDRSQAAIGTLVYLDLIEIHNWWDIVLDFNGDLQQVFVSGKPSRNGLRNVVIPVEVQQDLTFADLMRFQSVCSEGLESVVLALCDQDSTIVYYELADGIKVPDCPEAVEQTRQAASRAEVKKRRYVHTLTEQFVSDIEGTDKLSPKDTGADT